MITDFLQPFQTVLFVIITVPAVLSDFSGKKEISRSKDHYPADKHKYVSYKNIHKTVHPFYEVNDGSRLLRGNPTVFYREYTDMKLCCKNRKYSEVLRSCVIIR